MREKYHRVPKIRENRVPRIREIGSLQIRTGFLTYSLKKPLQYCNIIMVHKLVNMYTKLSEPVTVQDVLLWASGAQNSRTTPFVPVSLPVGRRK